MSYAESAFEQLYENEGLTDELTDDEAKPLYKWAEDQIMQLDAQNLDEETFDDRFKQVRRAMSRINSFVAKRADFDDDEARKAITRFTEGIYEIGYEISQPAVDTFLEMQPMLNNLGIVHAMLKLMATEPDQHETDLEEND